jgi:hypothetical protein
VSRHPRRPPRFLGLHGRGLRLQSWKGIARGIGSNRAPYSAAKAAGEMLVHSYVIVRDRRRRNARVQHVWAVPAPGEARPAVHHQRDRRSAAPALRRRAPAARLAVRVRSRRGDRARPPPRRVRRNVQRARRHRARESRGRGAPARATRQALVARPASGGSAGPRPALLPWTGRRSRPSAGGTDAVRRRAGDHHRLVPGERGVVAGDRSGDWDAYYERQYGARLAGSTGAP